ncbi:MAG TPA: hypothetical protein VFV38_36935 [Ktedonobacteraceae bacterium]|nr:hypothetical protein [Ktedonobacteraceae bacterium]
MREHRPRFSASHEIHRQFLNGYFQAVQAGEMAPLMNLLSEDVILWTDGGGKIKQAALHPIRGRDAVARFSLGTKRFWPENSRIDLEEINGQTALIVHVGAQVFCVLTIEVEEKQIQTIRVIVNPEKLTHV